MILKLLFKLVLVLLNVAFSWVSLPAMPDAVTAPVDTLFEYLEQGLSFVWLIVPKPLVVALLPVVMVLSNFDKLYSMVMWILRKIPMLGIK